MFSYTNWEDRFGDNVSRMRELRTGRIELLYDEDITTIPGMRDALYACWVESITPKIAATRYIALVDHAPCAHCGGMNGYHACDANERNGT